MAKPNYWIEGIKAFLSRKERKCPPDCAPLESHDWYEGYDLASIVTLRDYCGGVYASPS